MVLTRRVPRRRVRRDSATESAAVVGLRGTGSAEPSFTEEKANAAAQAYADQSLKGPGAPPGA
jgi:hypothetical protein